MQIVDELAGDPDIQVVVFDSGVPDFFFNHFDLAAAADFPAPEGEDAVPVWTDLVLKLSKAPYITIATIRRPYRGGGKVPLALDLRYASREHAIFGQPEVGVGLLPGGGGTERLPRTIGRDRALEAILTSDDYDADTAERWGWVTRALPDSELDAFVDAIVARLASFDRASLASAKAMIGNRAVLPPDAELSKLTASLPARSPYQVSSPALRASRRLRTRSASTSRYRLGRYRHRQPRSLTTGRAQWRGSSACSLSCCFTKGLLSCQNGRSRSAAESGTSGASGTSLNASSPPHVNSSTRTASMRSPRTDRRQGRYRFKAFLPSYSFLFMRANGEQLSRITSSSNSASAR